MLHSADLNNAGTRVRKRRVISGCTASIGGYWGWFAADGIEGAAMRLKPQSLLGDGLLLFFMLYAEAQIQRLQEERSGRKEERGKRQEARGRGRKDSDL